MKLGDVVMALERDTCLEIGMIGLVRGTVEVGGRTVLLDVKWFGGSSPWLSQESCDVFVGPLTLEQIHWLKLVAKDMQRDINIERIDHYPESTRRHRDE